MKKVYTTSKKDYDPVIRIGGFLVSVFLFWLADYIFNFGFEQIHYLIFILICGVGILLSHLYYKYEYYDKVLHFMSPFLACFIAFFLIDKIDTTYLVKLFLTFTFVSTGVSIFEIGEYILDKLLGWELQGVYLRERLRTRILQSKHDDAMQDIIFGVAGAIFFVIIKIIFQ